MSDWPRSRSVRVVDEVTTPPNAPPGGTRIIGHFRPQAWINDFAVDIDGAYDFDCTEMLLGWPLERVLAITDHSYEADEVWQQHPVRAQKPHSGPFEVEVVDSIAEYLRSKVAGSTT